ncbi:MAG: MFS transporter [Acidimicrobiales bacterium]
MAYLAVMPLAGRLSDVFGRRRVFEVSLAIFAVGSLVVPLAPNLGVFLLGRALTAVGGGALVPVALGIAGDHFEGRNRAQAFGLLGAIETLGWIWGPIYGALLVRFLSWEWQFYLNLPLAVLGLVLARRHLPQQRVHGTRLDLLGAGLLTLALTASSLALLSQAKIQSAGGLDELAGRDSTSIPLWLSVSLGVVGAAGFVWRQRTADPPLLDLSFPAAHHAPHRLRRWRATWPSVPHSSRRWSTCRSDQRVGKRYG